MKKESTMMVCLLLILWVVSATVVGNDILIPHPMDVVKVLFAFLQSKVFYASVGYTVVRVLKGFLISMVSAFMICLVADHKESFRAFFTPLQVILKTIPNVSYMILAIIWLGANGSVSVVSFMILFPVFFNSFMNTLDLQNQSLKDVERLYTETFWQKTKTKTLPLLKKEMLYTGKTCCSLGLKVGVMAEILGQVRIGIGRQIYLAKMNLDTTSILAYTVVIILLSLGFDTVFDGLIAKNKEGKYAKAKSRINPSHSRGRFKS